MKLGETIIFFSLYIGTTVFFLSVPTPDAQIKINDIKQNNEQITFKKDKMESSNYHITLPFESNIKKEEMACDGISEQNGQSLKCKIKNNNFIVEQTIKTYKNEAVRLQIYKVKDKVKTRIDTEEILIGGFKNE